MEISQRSSSFSTSSSSSSSWSSGGATTTTSATSSQSTSQSTTVKTGGGVALTGLGEAASKAAADLAKQTASQNAQLKDAFATAKPALPAQTIGRGCCMPNFTPETRNKIAESLAQSKFDKVSKEALADGKVNVKEQRDINSAGRDLNIAKKQVQLDGAKAAHQTAVKTALADGHVTPAEASKINNAQTKIDNLQGQLNKMKADDKKADLRDRMLDAHVSKPGAKPAAKPAETAKPAVTAKPAETAKPAVTAKPAETAKPMMKPLSPEARNKIAAGMAKAKHEKVTKDALADGKVNVKEQRSINSANRDLKIAEKRVQLDAAKAEHAAAKKEALANGNISAPEAKKINDAQAKIDKLEGQLKKMEAHDKKADARDKALDAGKKRPSLKEQGAIRDKNIAEKRTEAKDARAAHQGAVKTALADGRVTTTEQQGINKLDAKADKLEAQLRNMVATDKKLDARDKAISDRKEAAKPAPKPEAAKPAETAKPAPKPEAAKPAETAKPAPKPDVFAGGSPTFNEAGGAIKKPDATIMPVKPPVIGKPFMPAITNSPSFNKLREGWAQQNFDKVSKNALADGSLTAKETRDVNSAGRDLNIAKTRVQVDEAKAAHAQAVKAGLADGRVTSAEAMSINAAQSKVDNLQKKLDTLVTQDRHADFRDAIADKPFWASSAFAGAKAFAQVKAF